MEPLILPLIKKAWNIYWRTYFNSTDEDIENNWKEFRRVLLNEYSVEAQKRGAKNDSSKSA